MSSAYNHMKRSHRSQRGHYMAANKRYVKNAMAHNAEENINPMKKIARMFARGRRRNNDNSVSAE